MALPLTLNALNAALEQSIELNIVFEIEGVSTLFGAVPIRKFVRIGDPGLEIGDPELSDDAFYIGGFNLVDNQQDYLSFKGTTTNIRQQLQIDKGRSSGVGSFKVSLIDQNEEITLLVTPDNTQTPAFDILGRRARVYVGFINTAWPEDYVTIFRGPITQISPGAGFVSFNLNSPENKQRSTVFNQVTTELTANMLAGDTVANVDVASDFLTAITPPGGGPIGNEFEGYVRINDEIIRYTATTAGQLQGLSRGQFGTTAAAHSSGDEVVSFYRLQGNPLRLALQLMLSGFNGPFVEEVEILNILSDSRIQSKEVDFRREYNIQVGDFVSITGSLGGTNDVLEAEVLAIEVDEDLNTFLTLGGVSFTEELETNATISIRSQFDVLPDGAKMLGDEVDINQHEFIRNTFLPSPVYDFRLKEEIEELKEFLEDQIYSPVACFSIPRNAQSSVGYHIGPIPGQDIKFFGERNVKSPSTLKINRSTERYFYNEIIYKYDEDDLEDRFLGGVVTVSQTSKNQIKNRESTLIIESQGLRSLNSALNIATDAGERRLDRYQFGAEFIEMEVLFGSGFNLEIGDIVLVNGDELKLSDIQTGSRNFQPRLMEIQQKELGLKDGRVKLTLADTNFDGQARYGLISPASKIKSGINTNQFIIERSFGSIFGQQEFLKWQDLIGADVRVRSSDFTRDETVTLNDLSGNQVTVTPALSFTPQPGDILELSDYDNVSRQVNLVYAFISENTGDDFPDTEPSYVLL